VVVTTDKVYQDREWHYPYREDDALGGHDPYSASKAACELVVASYRAAFLAGTGVAVASARAGNVIGGGDWAQARLIPDAVRAWSQAETLQIRRPGAVRPWQHVLEPLAGYMGLAAKIWHQPDLACAYNFGPDPGSACTVGEVVEMARSSYGRGEVALHAADDGPHETHWLGLETAKARHALGMRSRWALPNAVARTMHWYRDHALGLDARALCLADITAYEVAAA